MALNECHVDGAVVETKTSLWMKKVQNSSRGQTSESLQRAGVSETCTESDRRKNVLLGG